MCFCPLKKTVVCIFFKILLMYLFERKRERERERERENTSRGEYTIKLPLQETGGFLKS